MLPAPAATRQTPALHLSWSQTPTGKQIWTIHHTPACATSCAAFIRLWWPLTTHPFQQRGRS